MTPRGACAIFTSGAAARRAAGGDAAGGEAAADPCADAGPFICRVVDFAPGEGAGFGQAELPDILYGPPHGAGTAQGSTDVLSLGAGGEITVELGAPITDGEGPDLVVFENPFLANGDPDKIFAELGEVSVSDDGEAFSAFPCDPTDYRHSTCAGWHVVYATPENGLDPGDPEAAGGDPFDLADLGLSRARFVRVRDLSESTAGETAGFDLDAMAAVVR